MSDLPVGWNWATVGSVAESLVDGPFGSNLKTEHYQSNGVRVIRLQNIADGQFNDQDKAHGVGKVVCDAGLIAVGS